LSDGVVTLRKYHTDDVPLLLASVQEEQVARFADVRWAHDTPAELTDRIERVWPEAASEGRLINYAITDARSGELLGHFVVFGVDQRTGMCEVGFWLRGEARGHGAAGRAVDLTCRWAFDKLGIERVQASTDVENVATQRTLEKAGFQREGIMRSRRPTSDGKRADYLLYSRLKSD
jgi:RimJ/RimL family protein N-acetyltransferase